MNRTQEDVEPLDFLAHQLYMQSLDGGYGVLWLCMRDDIRKKWRSQAEKLFSGWRQHEMERQASRAEIEDEIEVLTRKR